MGGPTAREERALKGRVDELMNRCKHALSLSSRSLKAARKLYRRTCLKLYAYLERHYRRLR